MTSQPDAIVVGYGWAGAVVVNRLLAAGLRVTVIERGDAHRGTPCGRLHSPGDERLDFSRTQDVSLETFTLRHSRSEPAAPFRQLGSFLSGSGMGGAGVLWGGTAPRWRPEAFTPRQTYGDRLRSSEHDSAVVDWPITYDRLEPYYDRFETQIGILGDVDGSPHDGLRSHRFPVSIGIEPAIQTRFREAASASGYSPHVLPSAELPQAYTNPLGITRAPCDQHDTTMATPLNTLHPHSLASGLLTVLTRSHVSRILHDGLRATGVRYHDQSGDHEMSAPIVVVATWTLHNTRLLLLSGVGTPYDPDTGLGSVGRGYANHMTISGCGFFSDDVGTSTAGPYAGLAFSDLDPMTPGADFLGAAQHMTHPSTNPMPTSHLPVPPGTPAWGPRWKEALQAHHGKTFQLSCMGEVLPHRERFLDLDPEFSDAWGDPLLRLTFDWRDNERRMHIYQQQVIGGLLRDMGADDVSLPPLPEHYDMARYQNTHATGGAIAGSDPEQSVVDPMLRSWDLDNLWVVGASAFPSSSAPPPTLTVGAYANLAADSIVAFAKTGRHELW